MSIKSALLWIENALNFKALNWKRGKATSWKFMYSYITNLSLVGVGVKNLILYSGANLYRNSAVCASSSRPLSARAPSVSAAASGSASILSTRQLSSATLTMPRPTASTASSARECSSTSRPSSTSASLRRRLLRALGNAGTGSHSLAAGGDGGQRALGSPRNEKLEDEIENESETEFWGDSSSSLQCFH